MFRHRRRDTTGGRRISRRGWQLIRRCLDGGGLGLLRGRLLLLSDELLLLLDVLLLLLKLMVLMMKLLLLLQMLLLLLQLLLLLLGSGRPCDSVLRRRECWRLKAELRRPLLHRCGLKLLLM